MKSLIHALCWSTLFLLLAAATAVGEPPPRYPKKVERPRPPAGPDGKPLVTVDGRWYSNFGFMELEQDQWTFTGSYSCCCGEIRGELFADKIEFSWEDPIYGEGWGYFRPREEGRRLAGVWGVPQDMGSSGGWGAVRLEERDWEGEPTRWSFAAVHPENVAVEGEAVLHFAGERIAGQLEGSAVARSEAGTFRSEIFRYLEGRLEGDEIRLEWHNPLTNRKGEIRLTRSEDRLDGSWSISEDTEVPIAFRRSENP